MIKRILYQVRLTISIVLFLLLFAKIGQCEEESYGWYGNNNIEDLLLLSGLFLFIEFIIFIIDSIILLVKKFRKKEVNSSELKSLKRAVLIFIFWLFILIINSNNGSCDIIIGPADTGLCLAMLAITIINYWKLKSLKIMKNKPNE